MGEALGRGLYTCGLADKDSLRRASSWYQCLRPLLLETCHGLCNGSASFQALAHKRCSRHAEIAVHT